MLRRLIGTVHLPQRKASQSLGTGVLFYLLKEDSLPPDIVDEHKVKREEDEDAETLRYKTQLTRRRWRPPPKPDAAASGSGPAEGKGGHNPIPI